MKIARSVLSASMWLALALGATPSSGADWSEDRAIDVHAHIGTFRGFDLGLDTLLASLDRHGVRMALISNIDGAEMPGATRNLDETAANRATADAVRAHPSKLRGLVWTRPKDGSPETVEPFLRDAVFDGGTNRLFVGLKFHPEMNHFPADDPRVDGYLRLCEKYGVPAVFHCGRRGSNSDPAKIHAAARRHPSVPVILYHMGFGDEHDAAIEAVRKSLRQRDASLHVETSQANVEAVLRAVRRLGSERVLFGTDATYYGRNHYAEYERLVARLRRDLSAEDFARVMRGNAERLFRLE